MKNEEMMTLKLTRLRVCDIHLALTCLLIDYRQELQTPGITEDRKQIIRESLKKWQAVSDDIHRQFAEQDAE